MGLNKKFYYKLLKNLLVLCISAKAWTKNYVQVLKIIFLHVDIEKVKM